MNARLVTSPHEYLVPKVREVAASAPSAAAQRRTATQRERVAASLLACPERAGAAPKGGIAA